MHGAAPRGSGTGCRQWGFEASRRSPRLRAKRETPPSPLVGEGWGEGFTATLSTTALWELATTPLKSFRHSLPSDRRCFSPPPARVSVRRIRRVVPLTPSLSHKGRGSRVRLASCFTALRDVASAIYRGDAVAL